MKRSAWRRLLRLGRPDPAAEVSDEIDAHLALQVADLVAEGWSPEAAHKEALRRFGDRRAFERETVAVDRRREVAMRRREILSGIAHDVRLAVRQLWRRPVFALVAIAVIALGIGANGAVFGVVDAALLRPLPFPDGDRMVFLWDIQGTEGEIGPSLPEYRDWERDADFLDGIMAVYGTSVRFRTDTGWEVLSGARVAGAPNRVLGYEPILGRWFTPEELRTDARVVILDEGVWRERFDGRRDIVGQEIPLGPGIYTIVGVLPRSAALVRGGGAQTPVHLWLPFKQSEAMDRSLHFLRVVGRIRPSLEQARAATQVLADRLKAAKVTDHGIQLQTAREALVGNNLPVLVVLVVAALFVFLIVCANLASLFSSKYLERGRELAVRVALGAGRARLVRLVLTESLIVGALGGVAGLLFAHTMIGITSAAAARAGALAPSSSGDPRVLAFTLATALLVGAVFGLWTAMRATRVDPAEALKEGEGRHTGGRRAVWHRKMLVTLQVAVSVVLLAATGLLLRSLLRMLSEPPGFDGRNVLAVRLLLGDDKFEDESKQREVLAEIGRRIRALPGVVAAGVGSELPLEGSDTNGTFHIVGQDVPEDQAPASKKRVVGPGYFESLRIPVVSGRAFTEADGAGAPDVVLISETLRRRHWPGEDPVGKRIRFSWGPGDVQEIVGVVGDVRHDGLDRPIEGILYRPIAQFPQRGLHYLVRTAGDPLGIATAVRREVGAADSTVAMFDVRTMDSIARDSTAARRTTILLLTLFAAIALVLAALGVYGVVSQVVGQRTREIGLRMAVGAQRGDVLRLVLGEAIWMILVGLAVGVGVALALARALSSFLYGVSAGDPVTFVTVSGLIGAIGVAATLLPARRAANMDPLVALRSG